MGRSVERRIVMGSAASTKILNRWDEVVQKLNPLSTLKIPRFIGSINDSNIKLLIFCDASQASYAAAVYLHIEGNNSVEVNLVFSKSRLASSGKSKGNNNSSIGVISCYH